jgi:hypothetical protein
MQGPDFYKDFDAGREPFTTGPVDPAPQWEELLARLSPEDREACERWLAGRDPAGVITTVRIGVEEPNRSMEAVIAMGAALGKTFPDPKTEYADKVEGPKRPRVRFLPDYVAREHDGPDPKTLPRRARRMRVPGRYEFHLNGRDRRGSI